MNFTIMDRWCAQQVQVLGELISTDTVAMGRETATEGLVLAGIAWGGSLSVQKGKSPGPSGRTGPGVLWGRARKPDPAFAAATRRRDRVIDA